MAHLITIQTLENIGAGEGNRTLDTQLGKLRRRAQVTDIHEEPLYKVSQIFLVRTDSLYNGLLTSSRLPLAPIGVRRRRAPHNRLACQRGPLTRLHRRQAEATAG